MKSQYQANGKQSQMWSKQIHQKILRKFMNAVYNVPAPTEQVDTTGEMFAASTGITIEMKKDLQKASDDWIAGEQIMYAVLIKSLVKAGRSPKMRYDRCREKTIKISEKLLGSEHRKNNNGFG